jgi:hypothetical protein
VDGEACGKEVQDYWPNSPKLLVGVVAHMFASRQAVRVPVRVSVGAAITVILCRSVSRNGNGNCWEQT